MSPYDAPEGIKRRTPCEGCGDAIIWFEREPAKLKKYVKKHGKLVLVRRPPPSSFCFRCRAGRFEAKRKALDAARGLA